MANEDFSEAPRRADSKNPIFFLLNFWVRITSGAQGSVGRIFGVPSIEPLLGVGEVWPGGSIGHPPPQVESPVAPGAAQPLYPSLVRRVQGDSVPPSRRVMSAALRPTL